MKTICIIGNDKGGITKTSSSGSLADGLQTLGYSTLVMSGDKGSNLTLRKLFPNAIHYDVKDPKSMDAAMSAAMETEKDIVFFDFPGFSSDLVRDYFKSRRFENFAASGLRLVLAVVVTQHPEPISGGISWVETFLGYAEVMLIANGKDTPEGQPINLKAINGADMLLEIAENRVVEIPLFAKEMKDDYNEYPAVPSAYLPGGSAYKARGLHLFSSAPWQTQHTAVVRSVSKIAEWLVGKPIPRPFDSPDMPADPKKSAGLERLKALYSADAGEPPAQDSNGAEAKEPAEKGSLGKTKTRE